MKAHDVLRWCLWLTESVKPTKDVLASLNERFPELSWRRTVTGRFEARQQRHLQLPPSLEDLKDLGFAEMYEPAMSSTTFYICILQAGKFKPILRATFDAGEGAAIKQLADRDLSLDNSYGQKIGS